MVEEWSCAHELVTPAGTITFNHATASTYAHDPGRCVYTKSTRGDIDDAPLTPGALLHTRVPGAAFLTLVGTFLVRGVSAEADAAEARTDLIVALEAALVAIENTDGTYSWTPTGKTQRSLTVRSDGVLQAPGGWQKTYLFGLIAADPTIVVA